MLFPRKCPIPMTTQSKGRKKFSGFSKAQAFQLLNLKELTPWKIKVEPAELSDFFIQHLQRLRRNFDLEGYEEAKKLLTDGTTAFTIFHPID